MGAEVLAPKSIINLMGATATGKTAIAIELAKRLPIRIISVDSALIYKGMNIGTAKADTYELREAPHHLIDLINPDENYSVIEFVKAAKREITIAHEFNQIPFLVGGSMFYFNALLHGIDDIPATDLDTRKQITQQVELHGWESLYKKLQQIDPVSAQRIHPNHTQRIQRALEVYSMTGKPLSDWYQQKTQGILASEHCLTFALSVSHREILHQRISRRFKKMLTDGFENEVKSLLSQYPDARQYNAFKMVGYRQMLKFIDGEVNSDTMCELGIIATRQLAKRQNTWLRQWRSPLCWLVLDDANQIIEQVSNIERIITS